MKNFVQKDFVERIEGLLEGNDEMNLHCSGELASLYEQALINKRIIKNKHYYVIKTERTLSGIRITLMSAPRGKK